VGAVEEAKITLSDADVAAFGFPVRDTSIQTTITIDDFTQALHSSVGRIEATIGETLQRAGVGREAIDSVILTGGSTQVPAIARRLEALFPEATFIRTDVLGSVGLGLAMDAARKFGGARA
jgi:hypothetical chaperone protein